MQRKVVALGDIGVGKTCLIERWSTQYFSDVVDPTCAVGLRRREETIAGVTYLFHIWDTAGSDTYLNTTALYCRGAHGAALVFDVTNRRSFEDLSRWIERLEEPNAHPVPFIVIANKVDINGSRDVTDDEVKNFCERGPVPYFFTSAKTGAGVDDAFQKLMQVSTEECGASTVNASVVALDEKNAEDEAQYGLCC